MAKRTRASTTKSGLSSDRPWSDITEAILYSILSRLSSNVADFYAFSGVCTAWRSTAKFFKRELLASIPPLLMLRLANGGALRFQSITDPIHHMTSPLRVKTKNCIGASFGYLIIIDRSWQQPMLVDPFTSTTIRLPKQLFRIRFAILTAPPSSPDCMLLGWGTRLDTKLFGKIDAISVCELKGSSGTVQSWPFSFRNAIFHNGKAFVLLKLWAVMVMDLVHHRTPRLIAVKRLPRPAEVSSSYSMLTEAGGDLLLVSRDLLGRTSVVARPLDLTGSGWVRLTSLGGRALFLGYNRCEVLENAAEWEGEDCIYMVSGNKVVRQSLKDASNKVLIESLPQRLPDGYVSYNWISPISNQLPI